MAHQPVQSPQTLRTGSSWSYLEACTPQGDRILFTDCRGTGDRAHTHRVVPDKVSTWDPTLARDLFPTYCVLCHIAGGHAREKLAQLRAADAVEPAV
jgi:mono/diheme cytochrome c family protein